MQMEAHRERVAGAAGQLVLAAHVVAVRSEIKLARIGQPEALAVAVMAAGDPLVTGFLGAFAAHRGRAAAERPCAWVPDEMGVADAQHRTRRAARGYAAPAGLRAAVAAAIDDDALAPLAQLEGQGAGMRVLVEAARRRLAGIDQNEALPRL